VRCAATIADGLVAGAAAAVLSGAPSTLHAVATRASPLEATLAAGTLLLPRERRPLVLALAAVPVHLALSVGWAAALARVVPAGRELPGCVAGALAIAALDLAVIAPRWAPRVRALPQGRQWADHVAYGVAVGTVLRARRRRRAHAP
jgi:hypothetical protein